MMKGLGIDESMSNLTSTISGETSISSNARNDQSSSTTTTTNNNNNNMLYPQASSSSFPSPSDQVQPPPAKKKRSLPGNPDPDAEVIALSPKSLLATNRFVCEICNKGFQRDQNLQLHRRGHNLPWKLKQRSKTDIIRKKVYVCPEPSCVHHDPSRALGDLTGIKKHFCRKHGEKKWKCEKCSKKYAVQSDWKAHSKICGTREYRCDCGTLFSRRDSFITHRAFCDALAEESARAINPLSTAAAGVGTSSTPALSHLTLPAHLSSHHHQLLQTFPSLKREQVDQVPLSNSMMHTIRPDIPPWLACPPPQQAMMDGGPGHPMGSGGQLDHHQAHMFSTFHAQYDQNQGHHNNNQSPTLNAGPTLSSQRFQTQLSSHPQMSATALLQKAAEMGVAVSNQHQHHHNQQQQQQQLQQQQQQRQVQHNDDNNNNQMSAGLSSSSRGGEQQQNHHQTMHANSSSVGLTASNTGFIQGGQSSMLHDVMLMSSMQSAGFDTSGFADFHHQTMNATKPQLDGGSGSGGGGGGSGGGNDGMTRDFLGLRTFSHKDFLSMAGLEHLNSSSNASFEQQQQDHQNPQTPWGGATGGAGRGRAPAANGASPLIF